MRTIERRRAGSGQRMYALLEELYPLCRSITGDGVRETLRRIGRFVPLEIVEVPSGTRAFDWTVPDEWNVREAWIEGPDGRIIDHQADLPDHFAESLATLGFDRLAGDMLPLDAPDPAKSPEVKARRAAAAAKTARRSRKGERRARGQGSGGRDRRR